MGGDTFRSIAARFRPATTDPTAPATERRTWRAWSSDGIVAIAMLTAIVLVPVFGAQVRQLRGQLAHQADTLESARTIDLTLRRNIYLAGFAGTSLPKPIADGLAAAVGRRVAPSDGGFVVMAYTPMACEHSLFDGLQSLRENHTLKARGIATYVVVAERSLADRERVFLMRDGGLIASPIAFVSLDSMSHAFFPRADSTFDDEPIYLRLDRQLTIRSAFHADQRRPELLNAWLETIQP